MPRDVPDTAPVLDADAMPRDKRPAARGTVRAYWRLAGGFWRGATARTAWPLTILSAALVVVNIAVQYGINRWNAYFFNALDRKDSGAAMTAVGLFAALAVLASAVTVTQLIYRMRLQVRWRQWLIEHLAARWLGEQRFYRLSISAPDIDSPEFRIAEDGRIATEPVVDFASGIATAVLTTFVFFGVLWTVGGSATVLGVTIPGYMVFAAVLYSLLVSGSMILLGRPLIQRIEHKNAMEARLRFEMSRVRENAESIALFRGEQDEQRGIGGTLRGVVDAWLLVISQIARMTWLTNTNSVASPVVPLLLGAPGYLAGTMSLGSLMQVAAAFVQVQVALNWLVDNYSRIAEWLASVGRITGLWSALSDLDASVGFAGVSDGTAGGVAGGAAAGQPHRIMIEDSPDDRIHLDQLSVAQHNGRVVIDEADTTIAPGDKVLLTGESGTGKSTLIRAIAGLWPWGSGRVLLPAKARIAFLPQRPYIPLGTLRQILQYPHADAAPDDAALAAALERCGLRRLIPRLDDTEQWDKVLSGGEQQRISFARLLIQRPDIVIMDEATSALDTASQDSVLELFRNELAGCTLISVAHRPELEEYHDRKLTLHRSVTGVEMQSDDAEMDRRRRLSGLLRRSLRPRPSPDPAAPMSR